MDNGVDENAPLQALKRAVMANNANLIQGNEKREKEREKKKLQVEKARQSKCRNKHK